MSAAPSRVVLRRERSLCFAHRGGADLWPENTLQGFRGSIALGCDFIESDLQLTRDGELVLCHDSTVDRTTDGTGTIAELTLAELQRFEIRDTSRVTREPRLTIPTLAEALDAVPTARFNLDIKSPDPQIVGRLVDFIESSGVADRVLVASRHDAQLERFRSATRSQVATSASAWEVTRFWLASSMGLANRLRPEYDALQVPPTWQLLHVVDERFVSAAHALGLQVHVFTVNAPDDMRRWLTLGVDGIMTDRPDRLVPIAEHQATLERESQDPAPSSRDAL